VRVGVGVAVGATVVVVVTAAAAVAVGIAVGVAVGATVAGSSSADATSTVGSKVGYEPGSPDAAVIAQRLTNVTATRMTTRIPPSSTYFRVRRAPSVLFPPIREQSRAHYTTNDRRYQI
jgi:hypothetical protein